MKTFSFFLILIFFSCAVEGDYIESLPEPEKQISSQFNKSPIINFDWQGHRGARGLMPENSIPGFKKALEFPVTTLELDLVISKDKKVIISHEPWFNYQICLHPDGSPISQDEQYLLNIYQMKYDSIKKYDCGIIGHPNFPNQLPVSVYKPLFRKMVKKIDKYCKKKGIAKPHLNMEIKSHPDLYGTYIPFPKQFVKIVLKEIKKLGIENRVTLQSFDTTVLNKIHKSNPLIPVSYLIFNNETVSGNLSKINFIPDIYSPHYSLLNTDIVDELHQKGIKVIPWTVNTTSNIEDLINMGVDGIITDYPDLIY